MKEVSAKRISVLMVLEYGTTLARPVWTPPRFLDSGEWCRQRYWSTFRRAPPGRRCIDFGSNDFRGASSVPQRQPTGSKRGGAGAIACPIILRQVLAFDSP